MKGNNWDLIKQLELINSYIQDECSEYVFYKPKSNMRIFCRIKNASDILFNNALRLIRNQYPIIKSSSLTLVQTQQLMFQMYKLLLANDFPAVIEDKIKKLMQNDFALNPDELLKDYPSANEAYIQNYRLLHGTN
ncbi:hypothetical protein IJ556_08265 [bacterium]|nr:hypothetical protein [bacterium]MBR2274154.1 hypothetical protein [Alphaproteobacteria bacterium]